MTTLVLGKCAVPGCRVMLHGDLVCVVHLACIPKGVARRLGFRAIKATFTEEQLAEGVPAKEVEKLSNPTFFHYMAGEASAISACSHLN